MECLIMEDHVRPTCCQKKDNKDETQFHKILMKIKNFFFGCCK